MHRGVWWAAVPGVARSRMQLSAHAREVVDVLGVMFPEIKSSGDPLQCSCLENPMGSRAWWTAVHGVAKRRTGLSDFTFTFHFHAPHSSALAWKIPGIGEPGRLPTLGLHRVRHD